MHLMLNSQAMWFYLITWSCNGSLLFILSSNFRRITIPFLREFFWIENLNSTSKHFLMELRNNGFLYCMLCQPVSLRFVANIKWLHNVCHFYLKKALDGGISVQQSGARHTTRTPSWITNTGTFTFDQRHNIIDSSLHVATHKLKLLRTGYFIKF